MFPPTEQINVFGVPIYISAEFITMADWKVFIDVSAGLTLNTIDFDPFSLPEQKLIVIGYEPEPNATPETTPSEDPQNYLGNPSKLNDG